MALIQEKMRYPNAALCKGFMVALAVVFTVSFMLAVTGITVAHGAGFKAICAALIVMGSVFLVIGYPLLVRLLTFLGAFMVTTGVGIYLLAIFTATILK